MGAGPRNEAKRLTALAVEVMRGSEIDAGRITRLVEHGMTRNVDTQIRQVAAGDEWHNIEAAGVDGLIAINSGMGVLLGSHPNGYVRQATLGLVAQGPLPGVARMLAQRAVDGVPPVRDSALDKLDLLFDAELAVHNDGRMPTNVEKAARELVGLTKSVELCPDQLLRAVQLFNTRRGRYWRKGADDHHRHDLRETDRRGQLLDDLNRLLPSLTDPTQQTAAGQLIDFYERSFH